MAQKEKKPRSAAQIAHSQKLAAAAKERAALKKIDSANTPIETLDAIDAVIDAVESAPLIPQPQAPSEFQQAPAVDKDAMMVELMQKMMEMMQANKDNVIPNEKKIEEMARIQGVQISAQNGVQGQVFKYPVDKGFYPDPTKRLLADPELKRFAMEENYILAWDVTGETYEKYGITYTEPRFTVELYRHHFDENGEKTNQLQAVSRCMLHEDEFIATVTANELGFMDKFSSKEEMMDEVRYHRIRSWLLDLFRPHQAKGFKKKPTSIVVNGTVVEVVDTESVLGADAAETKAASVQSQVRF